MNAPGFTSQTFPVADTRKVAFLFAGYRGKVTGYTRAIRTLNAHGYTVITYEHSPAVIDSGDPHALIGLVDAIHKHAALSINAYDELLCTGASIGAGIGIGLQRKFPSKIRLGIYAGAGVSPSENIFEAPIFYFARRGLLKKGYNPTKLFTLWEAHEITADLPLPSPAGLVMALGTQDKIVNYHKATATLHAWRHQGVPISIITKQTGHLGIIRWYKQNLETLLVEAENLSF